ncbi:hypothetical protein BB560_000428 [Smittium megazygosporum]|nr:hypothetical protein BB560_000428 [Smittium megazygosporum]
MWNKREDFQVHSLPGVVDNSLLDLQVYAGQIEPDSSEKNMFFMLTKNTTNTFNNDTWVIWLNGGPGCTSMYGAFLEHGPFEFKSKDQLAFRKESWTKQVDVLFIDQPFGTGLSYTDGETYLTSYNEFSDYLQLFLKKFLEIFPEYKSKKLIISGESDAGMTVPYLVHSMLYSNKTDKPQVDLRGIAIGNGWIDPKSIFASYLPFIDSKMSITPIARKMLEKLTDICMQEYSSGTNPSRTRKCLDILNTFKRIYGNDEKKCINLYNYDIYDSESECGFNYPPTASLMTSYFQRDDVQKALNVRQGKENSQWLKCTPRVTVSVDFGASNASVVLMDDILKKIPVLLFVGAKDIAVNTIAHEYLISNLTWNGMKGFKNYIKQNTDWTIDGEVVGTYHTERNLTYSVIFDASHMVGYEKPRELLVLLSKFANLTTENLSFIKSPVFSRFGTLEGKTVSANSQPWFLYVIFVAILGITLYLFISKSKYKTWIKGIGAYKPEDSRDRPEYYMMSRPGNQDQTQVALNSPSSQRNSHDSENEGFSTAVNTYRNSEESDAERLSYDAYVRTHYKF